MGQEKGGMNMAGKRTCRTYRNPVRERTPEVRLPREEPMRRWSHPIPGTEAEPAPADETGTTPAPVETDGTEGAILEQMELQSQLLVDLLGAVNALTAALLAQMRQE